MLAKFRRIYLVISLLSTIYMVRTQPDFFEKILNETNARLNPELAKIMSDNYQVPEVHFAPRVPKTPEEVQAAQVMNADVQDYLKRAAATFTENTQVSALVPDITPEPTPAPQAVIAPVQQSIGASPQPMDAAPPQPLAVPPGPAVVGYENREQAIEQATSESEPSVAPESPQPSAPQPSAPQPTARVEAAVIKFESRQVARQFLYFKIRRHMVRFNIDDKIDAKSVSKLIAILKTSCISTSSNESGCEPNKRNTVMAEKGFFSDVESSEKVALSSAEDAETVWKLTCAVESESCLNSPTKFKSFRLLLTKAGLTNHVLARGFESQRVRASTKRMPSSVSSEHDSKRDSKQGFTNIEKVFVTQTSRSIP